MNNIKGTKCWKKKFKGQNLPVIVLAPEISGVPEFQYIITDDTSHRFHSATAKEIIRFLCSHEHAVSIPFGQNVL